MGNRQFYTPSIVIAQQKDRVLFEFQGLLGTEGIESSISTHRGSRTGHEISRLTIHGKEKVFRFLVLVLPYLRVKRPEAELTLQLLELMRVSKYKLSDEDLRKRKELADLIRRDRRRPHV